MEKREEYIKLMLTKQEKDKLQKLAKEKNLDMSNYIRTTLLK